jgi:transposase-like protein
MPAQRDRIVALMQRRGGNVTAVAGAIGKARMQVQRWLKLTASMHGRSGGNELEPAALPLLQPCCTLLQVGEVSHFPAACVARTHRETPR